MQSIDKAAAHLIATLQARNVNQGFWSGLCCW